MLTGKWDDEQYTEDWNRKDGVLGQELNGSAKDWHNLSPVFSYYDIICVIIIIFTIIYSKTKIFLFCNMQTLIRFCLLHYSPSMSILICRSRRGRHRRRLSSRYVYLCLEGAL